MSAKTISPAPADDALLAERDHRVRLHLPLEGAAERDADRDADGELRVDPRQLRDGLVDGAVRVAPIELVGRSEREVDGVKAARSQPLVALLVEDEPRVRHAVLTLDPGDDLLRAAHLRHALGPDEADRLDAA